MGFGKIAVQIALDDPKRPRSGPDDPVKGALVLTYSTKPGWSDIKELFGPLKIQLLFSGEAITTIFNKSSQVRQIHQGRLSLFQQRQTIHDGKCTLAAGTPHRIPFALCFPERSDVAQWRSNSVFDTQRILPPSFQTSYSGFRDRFEAATQYKISTEVNFPGIDVEVYNAVDFVPILYTPPPMLPEGIDNRGLLFKDCFKIQNEQLLFEEFRPKGILQKTKAALKPSSSYPTWRASVLVTIPQHVYLEQGVPITVTLRPDFKNYAEISPEIYLDRATITITGTTFVRANGPREDYLAEGSESVATYTMRPVDPFSKRTDYTKHIQTAPIRGFSETFSTYNITRTYSMNVEIRLQGAGETMTIQRTLPIYVHSRILAGNEGTPVAGSSSHLGERDQRPEYKPPPDYEDTLIAAPGAGDDIGTAKLQ